MPPATPRLAAVAVYDTSRKAYFNNRILRPSTAAIGPVSGEDEAPPGTAKYGHRAAQRPQHSGILVKPGEMPTVEPATASKFRSHDGVVRRIFEALLCILTLLGAAWALELHNMTAWVIFKEQYLALILGIGLVCVFLGVKARKGEREGARVPWYDWIAVAASIGASGYVVLRYPALVQEISSVSADRVALGGVAVLLVLEATRRLLGWVLVWLALTFIVYAKFSHLFPGILNAPSTEWDRLATYLYLDTNSLLGLPLTVMSTIIIAFILFGRILYALNADKFLTDAAMATMGRYRGGPAKVAVAASSLFGTISGSVVSNVVMDGPITIPMMQRAGYRPHVAAAIEAVASTGGQIMPPVMGITAFLIADWLGIPYAEVIIAALFPAILYYVALFIQVDLEASKAGLTGLPAASLPRILPVLKAGWVFIVPIVILIYTLIALAWQPGKSAMTAVLAALAIGYLQPGTRPTLRTLWACLVETGQTVLDLAVITAIAGLVIGSLQVSGLAFGMSMILVETSAGSLLALLAMTAVLSIVLGMGMPTTVIYILLAILVAPALVDFGVEPLAAHLFLFYFGMLSMITPPLCIATFAAATIARCNFWSAGWTGVKLGAVAYVIPFIFVFHPELLLIGTPVSILLAVASALVGVVFIASSCAGFWFSPIGPVLRVALLLAGIALIPSPAAGAISLASNVAGLVLGLAIGLFQYRQRHRDAEVG